MAPADAPQPRLRPNLEVLAPEGQGLSFAETQVSGADLGAAPAQIGAVVVRRADAGAAPGLRLTAEEWALVQRLDGRQSLAEVLAQAQVHGPTLSLAAFEALVAALAQAGLVEGFSRPPKALPQRLSDEMTALSDEDTAYEQILAAEQAVRPTAPTGQEDATQVLLAMPQDPGLVFDPSLFTANLTATGVGLDPKELDKLLLEVFVRLDEGAAKPAVDILRGVASLAPGQPTVQAIMRALEPFRPGGLAQAPASALWQACQAAAPELAVRAQAHRQAALAAAPPSEASQANTSVATHPLAPATRLPLRALAAVLLIMCVGGGGMLWWWGQRPKLPVARLLPLEVGQHLIYEGPPATSLRVRRSLPLQAPVAGEVRWLVAPHAQVQAQDDLLKVLATGAAPGILPAQSRALQAAERRQQQGRLQIRRLLAGRGQLGRRRPAEATRRALKAAEEAEAQATAELARLRAHAAVAADPGRLVVLKAPFAGQVMDLRVAVGQPLVARQALATLVDRQSLRLRFAVAANAPGHRVGEEVLVATDLGTPGVRPARVVEVQRAGRDAGWLEVELPDPRLSLPALAMAGSFRLVREVVSDAFFVPKRALVCNKGRCQVWQLVAGRAQAQSVRVVESAPEGAWLRFDGAPDGAAVKSPLIVGVGQDLAEASAGAGPGLDRLRPGQALLPAVL